jgi:hypothetical protein
LACFQIEADEAGLCDATSRAMREQPVNRIRWTEMVKRRPESTGGKQVTGRELTQFKPGQSGNPKGRPRGSRNKLSEDFFRDLCNAWASYGKPALTTAAMTSPTEFVRVVAGLMPKDVEVVATQVRAERLSDNELANIASPSSPDTLEAEKDPEEVFRVG